MRLSEKWSQTHPLCKPESTVHQRSKSQPSAQHIHQTLDVCLSLGQGCHLLTLLVAHSGVCAGSVAAFPGYCCTAASPPQSLLAPVCECRFYLPGQAAFAGALCGHSDSSVELSQGVLLMQRAQGSLLAPGWNRVYVL